MRAADQLRLERSGTEPDRNVQYRHHLHDMGPGNGTGKRDFTDFPFTEFPCRFLFFLQVVGRVAGTGGQCVSGHVKTQLIAHDKEVDRPTETAE